MGGAFGWALGFPSPADSPEVRASGPYVWAIIGVIVGTLIGWFIEEAIREHRDSPPRREDDDNS